jgi:cell division inhibitor SepF
LQGNPRGVPNLRAMGFSDSWHKTLVYFGLAEDREAFPEEEIDEPPSPREAEAELEDRYRERPNVRRLSSRRRRDEIDDIFADDPPSERRTGVLRPVGGGSRGGGNGRGEVRVHLVIPKSFNDAQDVADKFKDSIPVIINLQGSEPDLSKRLIDFASGLTYALDGGMQRIADKVFLLTPRNVEVSAEERARLIEKGFFNQS